MTRVKYFALIGAAGFVAPRHLQAIANTQNRLLAAVDPHDSVGVLDQYFPEAQFFTELGEFAAFLQACAAGPPAQRIAYVSVCSPNHLHDLHAALGLRAGAHVICEKPLALDPMRLDTLQRVEQQTGGRVYTILQLRLLPALRALRTRVRTEAQTGGERRHDVVLTYVTRRGRWYDVSWKGQEEMSGGVAMNIGIHFFDLLQWLFGAVQESVLHVRTPRRMAGRMTLAQAEVRWLLSLEPEDLPTAARARGDTAHRSLTLDGEEVEFTGFADLHTASYQEVLAGRGFGLEEARPAIESVHPLRTAPVQTIADYPHPALERGTM